MAAKFVYGLHNTTNEKDYLSSGTSAGLIGFSSTPTRNISVMSKILKFSIHIYILDALTLYFILNKVPCYKFLLFCKFQNPLLWVIYAPYKRSVGHKKFRSDCLHACMFKTICLRIFFVFS